VSNACDQPGRGCLTCNHPVELGCRAWSARGGAGLSNGDRVFKVAERGGSELGMPDADGLYCRRQGVMVAKVTMADDARG